MTSNPSRVRGPVSAWEWPTLALAALIYGGWLAVTAAWTLLPASLAAALLAWLVAWQSSLQHEIIHGHPTPSRRLNRALGWPPLGLWLPFELFRRAHLRHHREPWLTDPIEDPESAYLTAAVWERLGPAGRGLRRFNLTLAGRLSLGPFLTLGTVWGSEARRVAAGDRADLGVWLRHLAGAAAVLAWLAAAGVPIWAYGLFCALPGLALTRLRAFAEHRFADEPEHRTAIVEGSWLFGPLFLFNNLHVVHHRWPGVPWYRLPALYRERRDWYVARNGGLVYRGYGDVARRFLLRPHDLPVHPGHGEAGHGKAGHGKAGHGGAGHVPVKHGQAAPAAQARTGYPAAIAAASSAATGA